MSELEQLDSEKRQTLDQIIDAVHEKKMNIHIGIGMLLTKGVLDRPHDPLGGAGELVPGLKNEIYNLILKETEEKPNKLGTEINTRINERSIGIKHTFHAFPVLWRHRTKDGDSYEIYIARTRGAMNIENYDKRIATAQNLMPFLYHLNSRTGADLATRMTQASDIVIKTKIDKEA